MSSLVGHWLQLCCSPLHTHTCTHLSHTHAAGYKGYGLAMMVEMICGVLGGGPYAHHIREWTMADKVANLVWTIYKDMVYIYHSLISVPLSFHSSLILVYLSPIPIPPLIFISSHTHTTQVSFPVYPSLIPIHASIHEVLLTFVFSARHLLHWIRGRLLPTLSHECAPSCKK